MNPFFKHLMIFLSCAVLISGNSKIKNIDNRENIQKQSTTDWRIEPSFKYDTLCFLNTLTADPYYLDFYRSEYEKFEPMLNSSVRNALLDLKKKVKDDNKTIISAFLCLYFSAVNDENLDDLLDTVHDGSLMKSNLKKTPYYNEEGWRLYESIRKDLKTIFLFLKDVDFAQYWKDNVLPKIKKKILEIGQGLPGYNIFQK